MALGILQALDSADIKDPARIYGDIHDVADNLRSLCISIREASWRQDGFWLRIHRAEFVRQAQLLAALLRTLAPLEGEVTEAKRKGGAK